MSGTVDPRATEVDQQELVQQLLAQAREQGIELVGPGRAVEPVDEKMSWRAKVGRLLVQPGAEPKRTCFRLKS